MSERKKRRSRPRRAAAALRYQPSKDAAPQITGSGRGYVADRIIALAREHGIPIYDDPDLVEVLAQLDLGDVIPMNLYQVIAEVLVYVYRINSIAGRRLQERPAPYSASSRT